MRCLNMKIADIFFFITNFVAIYASELRLNKTSQMPPSMNDIEIFESKLSRDCPQLLEVVSANSLNNYAINCRESQSQHGSVEYVLQHVCFIVRDMLKFICDKKFNMTTDSLKRTNSDFCPFNFTLSEQLGIKFSNYDVLKELKNRDHCMEVCYDFDYHRPECSTLNKINNFLNSQNINLSTTQKDLVTPEINKPQVKPVQTKPAIQKTESSLVSTNSKQQPEKTDVTEKKEETINTNPSTAKLSSLPTSKLENKIEKAETIFSTPKKEQTLESEIKIQENENDVPENIEDDLNEDDLGPMGYPNLGLKSELAPMPNVIKTEYAPEEKNFATSLKQKDFYPTDKFLQAEDSHFFFYFIMVSSVIVIGYLAFHNKNKILAYALEGSNSRRGRRHPNPARYRKLETNLEEVISSSSTNVAASSVVY